MQQPTNELFVFTINTVLFFVREMHRNKKKGNVRVNKQLKLTTPKYATKNKLIVCFNNSHCLIFLCWVREVSKINYLKIIVNGKLLRTIPVGWAVTCLPLQQEVCGSNLGKIKSDTVLPMACHFCSIFSKRAVFAHMRNAAEMGHANLLHALS